MLLALALAASPAAGLDDRLRQSVAAAEALQGPLDGAWTLVDRRGRRRLALRIVQPPPPAPTQAAWSAAGELGVVDRVDLRGDHLTLAWRGGRLDLHRRSTGLWEGLWTRNGRAIPVTLRRVL